MEKLGFSLWLSLVDKHMKKVAGITHQCLADQPYRDWFEDGVSPKQAAEDALVDDGFPQDLLEEGQ